ncbi:unnamed protein product [Ceutorhynchus assimilis]|uniref:Uncharacterized protein n=1 Tax=Ceutorhynchus assimilis TaxID=467358 RepID=A0A9P0DJ24_9CUCU|nr:unnamed protein product [Ceutorhynchus assimilis]
MKRPTQKTVHSSKLILLILIQLVTGAFGTSDDITNIWFFGCRWFGGITNMLSCNCAPEAEEMYIQRNSIPAYDVSNIEISNCSKVRFGPKSVYDLNNLRQITLNNIQSLVFEANSLEWVGYKDSIDNQERFQVNTPSLKVFVKNSLNVNIGSHSMVGRISEINFENVLIEKIDAFAFSNLVQMENLIFTNVQLKNVNSQAFKRFGTEFMILDGVKADYLPSRTFLNVTVYRDFIIRNCQFNTLHSGTFRINHPTNFAITNSQINDLQGQAFLVSTTGNVIIRNNFFNNVQDYAFKGITNEISRVNTIHFDSNTFGSLNRRSLDLQPQFEARVSNLNLNQTCDCDSIVEKLQTDFYDEIRCLYQEEYITVKNFKSQNCSVLAGYYTIMIVVCVAISVISIVAISFYVYYVLVYKRQKYGCEKGGKAPLSLIVPDGRTYKETELHVIVEKADLLTTDL